ncbi:MAG: hypothetical protein KA760_03170 [Steroidobacteraceae bacterium]|nr:hypothetical protein [Steroidobacteraceae bacterium]
MKAIMKTALLSVLLTVGSAVAAAPAADPVIGTWQINVAKSKFSPGPAPKSDTRIYAATEQGTAMTWTSVGTDGEETVVTSTFKTDGKDYPLTGSGNFDSLSLKQVDDHTVQSTQKKGSKVIGTTTRTVSKDGKVLTLSSKGTSATGVPYDNVMIYDKQ